MLKIFLVEDEIVVRESIRDSINWTQEGFIFSGEASDGEMAIPMIEEIQPDIIITDIKMPFMDGLELSRIIRKTMLNTKIIIISGYDEFDFARSAISVGAADYLLKPISPEDLLNSLKKVSRIIEEEKKEKENYKEIVDRLNASNKILKQRFLRDVCTGIIPSVEVFEKSQLFNIDIINKYFIVITVLAEIKQGLSYSNGYMQFLKVESVLNDIVRRSNNVLSFSKSIQENVLILKGDEKENLEIDSYVLAERIKTEIEKQIDVKITIAIGSLRERIIGISESFNDSATALNYRYMFDKNTIISIEDLKISNMKYKNILGVDYKNLIIGLKTKKLADIQIEIDSFIDQCVMQSNGSFFYSFTYVSLLIEVIKFINELGGNAELILEEYEDFSKFNIDTPSGLKCIIKQIFEKAYLYRESKRTSKYNDIIYKATTYIGENFNNPELDLNMVAKHVNISRCHFSTIFKQEMSKTFIQYLTQVRIEKAKELIKTTNEFTSEIGYLVGYKDSHYFSNLFKKTVGESPKTYRARV